MIDDEFILNQLERMANELVGIWIDHLGMKPDVLAGIERDIYQMFPSLIWQWGIGANGRFPVVVVLAVNLQS